MIRPDPRRYIQAVDNCPYCGAWNYLIIPRRAGNRVWAGYTECRVCGKIFYVTVDEGGHTEVHKYLPLRMLHRIDVRRIALRI